MSDLARRIAEILRNEFSNVTVGSLMPHCCTKIGKTPDSLRPEDLPAFTQELLQSIFLLSNPDQTDRISQKLEALRATGTVEAATPTFSDFLINRWFPPRH